TYRLTYDFGNSGSLGTNKGPNALCPQPITPMVAEKSTVSAAINALTAAGSTFINEGMAWGQRLISPNWRGLWGGQMNTNSLPLDYRTAMMNKVVILMTDGMNAFNSGNFTAYGSLSDGVLGTTRSVYSGYQYNGSAEQEMDNRTRQVC